MHLAFIVKRSLKEKGMDSSKTFSDYLRGQLSFTEFQELPKSMNVTLHRLNKLLRGKDDWHLDEISKIAKLLEQDPIDLIQDWRLGHKHITLSEMDSLLVNRGMRVAFEAV